MSVSPVYVDVISKRPIVMEFTDFTTESNNSRLSPGGIGRVKGLHLSFSKEDPQQGLFLVSEALMVNEIRAAVYSLLLPSELHFQLPAAPPGRYWLEVRTRLVPDEKLQVGRLQELLLIISVISKFTMYNYS